MHLFAHCRLRTHGEFSPTFANAVLVSVIVLIFVELAEQSWSTLHAVHSRDSAITMLSSARGTDLTATAVIQNRPSAPLSSAQIHITALWAIHRILGTRPPAFYLPQRQHKKYGEKENMHDKVCLISGTV